jgi:VWFA-related protein
VRPVLFLLFATLACAQEGATFRTGVTLVHIDAEVTDAGGRVLEGLAKTDFRVLDEGRQQPVLHFASTEEPLDLILLFDISGSMRPKVAEVAAAADEGLRQLREGDRVSVMVFNTRSRVILPFTEDLEKVGDAIRRDVLGLNFGGGTLIQSAVDDAALRFFGERRSERRRAVLIVTDNIGQRTRREASVVRDFWEADAILTGLIIANKKYQTLRTVGIILGPQTLIMQAGMKGIAEKTGGDAIAAADLSAAFPEAMRRIRTRYSLYYALPPAKPGARRTVRVELTKDAARRFPKARVRARTGYIVSEGASAK